MGSPKTQLKKLRYEKAKLAKVGDTVNCPHCNTEFVKKTYQQTFCKSKGGRICNDGYWNRITPTKRNNTTRISPASAAFMANKERVTGHTSEGYRIIDGIAYDEFDAPVMPA